MMKKKRVNLWLVLPEELISQIFTSLDLKSMIKCKLVCKQWHNHISGLISDDPLLGAKGDVQFLGYDYVHHRFGVLDDETHEIAWMKTLDSSWRIKGYWPYHQVTLSSCNGLVCFDSKLYHRSIYICNPILGEHINLPQPLGFGNPKDYLLGFCPTSNKYKLALVRFDSLEIYTLGNPNPSQSGSWKTVPFEHLAPEFGEFGDPEARAACVNGVFHWPLKTQSILTFDLAKEVFGSTPPPRLEARKEMYQLGCMDRCLVATAGYRIGHFPNGFTTYVEIWVRKEDKSSSELVWTKNWIIDNLLRSPVNWSPVKYRYFVPRKLSTDGCIIMTYYDRDPPFESSYRLYSYDPRNNLLRPCHSPGELRGFDYTPTLASPTKIRRQGPEVERSEEGK